MSLLAVLSFLWLGVALALIARAVQQSRLLCPLAEREPGSDHDLPALAVIVPARNEAANIETSVNALLAQHYPAGKLHVWVVDDCSSDGTAEIVEQLAESEPRLSLIRAPLLPENWTGKSHACWIAARAVSPSVQWLCFIDADMRAEPLLLANAVRTARAEDIGLLSLVPHHRLESFAERLMIPCGLCFLGFAQDLRGALPECRDRVVATGQFFLARRDVYDDVGGHAAVSSHICEDLELARVLRQRGARVCLKDGGRLLTTRMYTGWQTLWPGFAKNLTELLGGVGGTIMAAITSVALAWVALLLPLLDGLGCHAGDRAACIALLPALSATAAILALHIGSAIHLGIPFWYGFLFPLGYTAGAAIAFDSLRWRLTGRIQWKGRTYRRSPVRL